MNFRILDRQLARFSEHLRTEVRLTEPEIDRVATLVAAEIRFLGGEAKSQIAYASPVPLRARLDELVAFQAWMDYCAATRPPAHIVRAQVITQIYVCFVYLPESCFRILRTASNPGSVLRRCCEYLTNNPVRAFRNAVAHSNWTYNTNFSGLTFWAKKDSSQNEALSKFEVDQTTLNFWQMLSRTVAYTAYTILENLEPP